MKDPNRRGRRAVLDEARRRVERALAAAAPAEELAAAARAVVIASEDRPLEPGSPELMALREALASYREIATA